MSIIYRRGSKKNRVGLKPMTDKSTAATLLARVGGYSLIFMVCTVLVVLCSDTFVEWSVSLSCCLMVTEQPCLIACPVELLAIDRNILSCAVGAGPALGRVRFFSSQQRVAQSSQVSSFLTRTVR